MKPKRLAMLAIATALMTPFAASAADGMYFIGGIGQTTFKNSDADFSESGTSFRIGIGNKLQGNENVYWEAYYINYGTADKDYGGGYSVEVSGTGIALQGLFKNPTGPDMSIYGKLGLSNWNGEANVTTPFGSGTDSDSGSDIYFGIGAEKKLDDMSAIRFEWESIDFDVVGSTVKTTTLGIHFVKTMN